MKRAVVTWLAWVLVAGCNGGGKQIVQPIGEGKTDFMSGVLARGELDYGVPVEDSFTHELEFHSYVLHAADGAAITAEITQKGTSRDLDTTLFLFGPGLPDGGSGPLVDHDDDAGWGSHSRLSVGIAGVGHYTLVVGTADGLGKGAYRLLVSCDNGACRPPDTPLDLDPIEVPHALWDMFEGAQQPGWAYVDILAFRWSGYEATPTLIQAVTPYRDYWMTGHDFHHGYDEVFSYRGEISRDGFGQHLLAYDGDLEVFEQTAGITGGYRVGLGDVEFDCAPGATCWESHYVVLPAGLDTLYVVILGAGEE